MIEMLSDKNYIERFTLLTTNYNNIEIREFDLDCDSVQELTSLLNRSYKQLADKGFKYVATHQGDDITLNRIKKAYCLVGLINGKIVATITYYPGPGYEHCNWYEKDDVGYFGQFAVDPDLQKAGIGSKLIELIEKHARKQGNLELALDTAEGAHHLIESYKKRGYRFIEYIKWKDTNYRSVVMSKKLI